MFVVEILECYVYNNLKKYLLEWDTSDALSSWSSWGISESGSSKISSISSVSLEWLINENTNEMLAHVKGYDYNYEKVPDVVGKFMSDLFVMKDKYSIYVP